jgi:ABC-type multidrug transport system ATPase subunit
LRFLRTRFRKSQVSHPTRWYHSNRERQISSIFIFLSILHQRGNGHRAGNWIRLRKVGITGRVNELPAISVEALGKYFPPASSGWRALLHPFAKPTECALSEISFLVKAGEAVALVGPNGAGKSTLLRILATLMIPTSGRATLGGFDVERNAASARKLFGYHTGGDEGFYARLSARQNLAFFAAMNNISGAVASDRIAQISDWMGFRHLLDRPVRTLSTGINHRIGLARAMLHSPGILLLDEPTRSLDPLAASEFRAFLKEEIVRRRGAALLFASHTLSEVEQIADRVLVFDRGRLAASGTPRELCAATATRTLEESISRILRPASAAPAEPPR